MTVSSELAIQRHDGNGATVSFTTGFVFQANSHVQVSLTTALDVTTVWTENTHYTLTGANTGAAGTVVVISPTPQTDEVLTIQRNVPFTQTLDAGALTTLPASAIETALDKIWMGMGQLKSETDEIADDLTAWSPLLAVVTDGARRVLQVADWTGGVGTKPAVGAYVGATGLVTLIANGVDIRGATGASGAGTGDMVAANNLSDVAAVATAFANIKQAASTTATGVVELATDAEAIAKADTARAMTPSNLAALGASATFAGFAELATDAEAIAKADTARTMTPSNLAALGTSTTFAGLVELATDAEALAKADTARAVTPANLAALGSSATFAGFVELATNAEAITGTDTARAVTPAAAAAAIAAALAASASQPVPTSSTYAVGTFMLVYNNSAGNIANGSTAAGSALRGVYSLSAGAGTMVTNGVALSGTWKNVSGATLGNDDIGYWVRTA